MKFSQCSFMLWAIISQKTLQSKSVRCLIKCISMLSFLAPVSNQSVSYQGRRDSLQWTSFPETSRVFSFSAGMLILIKVEEMFLEFYPQCQLWCFLWCGRDLLISCMLLLSMSTWGYECFIQTCHHMLIFGSEKVLLLCLPHISVKCAVLLVIPAGK